MEGNGAAAAIVLAFLCGLGAWVLFTILPNVYRPARWPVVIVAALLGALNGCQKFGDAAITADQIERQLIASAETGEMARAFKRADPIAFDAYVEEIRAAMEAGEGAGPATFRASATLQAAAESRLGSRPAADVAAYYQLRRDELLEFGGTNPAVCRQVFFGGSEEIVPLSEGMSQRRMDLYLRAFGPISTAPPTPMSDDELRTALQSVYEGVLATVGDDADLLSPQTDATGREVRACEVIAEYMNQLALSAEAPRIYVTVRQARPRPA